MEIFCIDCGVTLTERTWEPFLTIENCDCDRHKKLVEHVMLCANCIEKRNSVHVDNDCYLQSCTMHLTTCTVPYTEEEVCPTKSAL